MNIILCNARGVCGVSRGTENSLKSLSSLESIRSFGTLEKSTKLCWCHRCLLYVGLRERKYISGLQWACAYRHHCTACWEKYLQHGTSFAAFYPASAASRAKHRHLRISPVVCVCIQGRKVHYKRQNNHTGTRRGSEVWPITILSCGRINITIIIIMELKWDFTFPNRLLWGFTFHNHRSRKTYINLSWRRHDDGLFGEATTAEKVFLGTTGRRFYSNTHYGCTMKSNWLSRKAK